MSGSPSKERQSLFVQLQNAGAAGDHEKGIKTANKILNEDPKNSKVFQCKIVSLIHLGRFEDAIRTADQANNCIKPDSPLFEFEKAYVLYRLNRVQEAYELLTTINSSETRIKELLAQVLYRLEKFEEAYEIYTKLIKNSTDEYEVERWTNMAAVMANLSPAEAARHVASLSDSNSTYEMRYNKACVLIASSSQSAAVRQVQLEYALKELQLSESEGRITLEEDGLTEDEIEADLALIRAQLGFVYQCLGREDLALPLYNSILKTISTTSSSDLALLAVVSNNVVSLNREANLFDSKRKLKSALTEANESTKLTSGQRRVILFNNALLLLLMNQREASRKALEELDSSESDILLLRAAIFLKEKKNDEAVAMLEQAIAGDTSRIPLILAVSQILLSSGNVTKASELLSSIPGPLVGVTSALVSLYTKIGDTKSLLRSMEDALSKLAPQDPRRQDLMQETAKACLESGAASRAVQLLEDLRAASPGNLKLLSQLIAAYSLFDSEKAKQVSAELPSIDQVIDEVDLDTLESASWSLGTKYARKLAGGEQGATASADKVKDQQDKIDVDKKSRRRKKKRPVPKNFDPNCDPDPERWLPKWQRSTFKPRKTRDKTSGIGKGTQGSTADVEIPIHRKGATVATAAPAPGPRQQRPGGAQKKSKGKGSKR